MHELETLIIRSQGTRTAEIDILLTWFHEQMSFVSKMIDEYTNFHVT